MDTDDSVKTIRGRGRGRGRGGRGRGVRGGRGGRGRGKKNVKAENEEVENVAPEPETEECPDDSQTAPKIDLEDISQLEAPTFTTLNRGPPEPMLRLRWDHRVNLVAEKVLNPMIHCCDKCMKPILIYGRMIPCKHVFCLSCAKREDKVCPRCLDKVSRVEQTGLGTVFMCTHGGTRYGSAGCRRTYLSQRDLQAHINHRHISTSVPSLGSSGGGDAPPEPPSPVKIPTMSSGVVQPPPPPRIKPQPQAQHMTAAGDPRIQPSPTVIDHHRRNSPPPPPPPFVPHRPPMIMPNYQPPAQPAPISNMRTNLITVQIQDTGMDLPPASFNPHYSHAPPPQQYAPPYGVPPPVPIPQQPPQFYPSPAGNYPPPVSAQPPQYGGVGPPPPPPNPIPRPPHYQEPMGQPYGHAAPPPQWQHPPPNTTQPFYR